MTSSGWLAFLCALALLASSPAVAITYSELPRNLRNVVAGRAVASQTDIVDLVAIAALPYGYHKQSFDVTAGTPVAFVSVAALDDNVLLAAYVRTPLSVQERHTAILLVVPSLNRLHEWSLIGVVSASDDLQAPLFTDADNEPTAEATIVARGLQAALVNLHTQRQ